VPDASRTVTDTLLPTTWRLVMTVPGGREETAATAFLRFD
jgi:hypothetical protein